MEKMLQDIQNETERLAALAEKPGGTAATNEIDER
jgi:hypothetical protein